MRHLASFACFALVLALGQGCSTHAQRYRATRDGESLYKVLYNEISAGDTIARVQELLGPAREADGSEQEILATMMTIAANFPDTYADGIKSDDTLLAYPMGKEATVSLLFRNGRLINYARESYKDPPDPIILGP